MHLHTHIVLPESPGYPTAKQKSCCTLQIPGSDTYRARNPTSQHLRGSQDHAVHAAAWIEGTEITLGQGPVKHGAVSPWGTRNTSLQDNCCVSWGLENCFQGQASWGCLPTPPASHHQSHLEHLTLMIFPSSANKLTPSILWANCSSCEQQGG